MSGRGWWTPKALGLTLGISVLCGGGVAGAVWASTPVGIQEPRSTGRLPRPGSTGSILGAARVPTGLVPRSARRSGAATSGALKFEPPVTDATAGPSAVPIRLVIPALEVAAGVVPVNNVGGALAVPSAISEVGWWQNGGIPGAPTGTTVLDGHVDSALSGLGALWPLRSAQVGDRITLGLAGGTDVFYRVTGVGTYAKADLPASIFTASQGPPALVMITCGGPFNRSTGHYADNVVVFAVPARRA